MIYLIGGVPRSGKTTVAKKLAMDLGISWISADTLEGLARHFTPSRDYNKKFPKTAIRKKTKNSNDLMYSKYTSVQIMNAYIIQAKSSWEVISTLNESLLQENHDYIIEGHQVAPKLSSELLKKYGSKKIKTVFLTRHDNASIIEAAKKGKDNNDWFIKKTKDQSIYPKIAAMISKYGGYLQAEAKKYHLPIYNMDEGFNKQIIKIINYLKG